MALFNEGDIIFVPQMCSLQSMVYYGEHRAEGLTCPCTWMHSKGIVQKIQGNFVYVGDLLDSSRKTAFHHSDITLVQKAGAEDGQD